MAAKFAVSLMALLGAVSAQTGYTNSSSIATSTTSSASSTFSNGAMVTNAGVVFSIMDDTTYSDVTPLQLSRKRQAASGIGSCLNTCSDNLQCAGASYSDDTMRCSYYSQINQDSEASSPGTDFALVESRPGASSSANSTTSATGTHSATRPGVSGSSNSTGSATGSSSRPAGITGAGNSTSSRPTGSVSRTSSSTGSSTPVPSSPSTIITIRGVTFLLEIDISYSGITIDFTILAKRAGQSLDDCLTTCSANSNCAGTSFEESTGTCTFFTSIDSNSRTPTNGVDFATVLSRLDGTGSGSTNGTSGAGNTTSPATNATAESFICPNLNGGVLLSNLEITFSISCNEFLIGTTFDLLSTIQTKRQAIENGLPQTLSNCVDLCSLSEQCVGTTFSENTGCSFYSAVSYATPMDGFDSATKVAGQGSAGTGAGEVVTTTTIIGGVISTTTLTLVGATTTQYVAAPSTATVFVTSVSTVTSYVGGATGLPSGATVTQVLPVSTITFVPSVSTITIPQNYAQSTVTVTVGGSGNAAPTVTESVTVTVDGNGNVIGSSTADAAAGAANVGSYPTVTIHDLYCPTSTAANVVFTTVYVR
ncbi:hypothetical protein KCU78_g3739, partial [Aureobasidium melanogenum]